MRGVVQHLDCTCTGGREDGGRMWRAVKCEISEEKESGKKCRDESGQAKAVVTNVISMKYSDGIHQCEVKERILQ